MIADDNPENNKKCYPWQERVLPKKVCCQCQQKNDTERYQELISFH